MMVHLLDGTYELFRHFYGRRRFDKGKDAPFGAVTGVLHTVLEMIEKGATHLGVATDHVIESFRNRMWRGYKTSAGIDPALIEASRTMGATRRQVLERAKGELRKLYGRDPAGARKKPHARKAQRRARVAQEAERAWHDPEVDMVDRERGLVGQQNRGRPLRLVRSVPAWPDRSRRAARRCPRPGC